MYSNYRFVNTKTRDICNLFTARLYCKAGI